MEIFANKSEKDKQAYYEFTADKKGLPKNIIEKDFWVCWTLKQLFAIPGIGEYFIFKGGTSLSKAYQLIERFSEDIDISIDKKYFGFEEHLDPENVFSKKKQQVLIKELANTCSYFVQERLKTTLEVQFSQTLDAIDVDWSIEIDVNDPDKQTLLFYYPTLSQNAMNAYIRPAIKIELGARGAGNPFTICEISPFIKEDILNSSIVLPIKIKTLAAERTFWEKATILHMYANWPENKKLPLRQSRHFFDFYKLITSNVKNLAEQDTNLLKSVAQHKKIYFRSGWADYDKARKGSLNLCPQNGLLKSLENDYKQMREMFYGEPVSWESIITEIKKFESEFNGR